MRRSWIRTTVVIVSGALLVAGVILLYLTLYGRRLFYSQTYHAVAELLPPMLNIWTLIVGLQFVLMFLLFTVFPGGKFRTIEFMEARPRTRKAVGTIGLSLSIVVGLFLMSGAVFNHPRLVALLARGAVFVPLVIFAALSLAAFVLAFYPGGVRRELVRPSWVLRLGAGCLSILLAVVVTSVIEITLTHPPAEQTAAPDAAGATHDVSVILSEYPAHLRPGDSTPIDLRFRITKHVEQERTTAYRYPITLPADKALSVGVNFQASGFDVISPTPEQLKPRPLIVDQQLTWTWLLSPKEGKAGTSQTVAFNVFLLEGAAGSIIAETPVTTIRLAIGTPLGLPTWLLSPGVGVGTIIGGLIGLLTPWMLGRLSTALDARSQRRKIISGS